MLCNMTVMTQRLVKMIHQMSYNILYILFVVTVALLHNEKDR
jgi:hypothetical protein